MQMLCRPKNRLDLMEDIICIMYTIEMSYTLGRWAVERRWQDLEATLRWLLVEHSINTEIFLDPHCSNCDLLLFNSNWWFDLEVAGWDRRPDPAEHPDTSWILAKLSCLDSQETPSAIYRIKGSTFQVYELVQRLSPSPVEMSLPWPHSWNLLWNHIRP